MFRDRLNQVLRPPDEKPGADTLADNPFQSLGTRCAASRQFRQTRHTTHKVCARRAGITCPIACVIISPRISSSIRRQGEGVILYWWIRVFRSEIFDRISAALCLVEASESRPMFLACRFHFEGRGPARPSTLLDALSAVCCLRSSESVSPRIVALVD